MGKLIISEAEKKRILNMHQSTKMKPYLFEEEGGPGTPTQPTTNTTPNPEPTPSTTLPENPTAQNPLKIRLYDVENGKRKENSYQQLDVFDIRPEDFGFAFRYLNPMWEGEQRSGVLERGNGKFYCDTRKCEIHDAEGNQDDVRLIWSDEGKKQKTFSDVVMKYWDNKCSKYVMNKNQTTNTGETTA